MNSTGKGGAPAGQVTSTSGAAPYMLPYISTALSGATSLYGSNGPQYYPGQQVAGFSGPQQKAMTGIDSLANNGTPGLNAAGNFDTTLLNGGMDNPYLSHQFDLAAGGVENQLTSQFGQAGRNAEAAQPLEGEALGNLAATMYGNQYQNTMQDALQAGNQAQSLYDTKLGGLNAELGVGGMVQNQGQKQIDANMQKYNYYQNLPYQQLGQYENFLSGVPGGTQSNQPYFTNPMGNALGYAMAGQSLYNNSGKGGGGKGGGAGGGAGDFSMSSGFGSGGGALTSPGGFSIGGP